MQDEWTVVGSNKLSKSKGNTAKLSSYVSSEKSNRKNKSKNNSLSIKNKSIHNSDKYVAVDKSTSSLTINRTKSTTETKLEDSKSDKNEITKISTCKNLSLSSLAKSYTQCPNMYKRSFAEHKYFNYSKHIALWDLEGVKCPHSDCNSDVYLTLQHILKHVFFSHGIFINAPKHILPFIKEYIAYYLKTYNSYIPNILANDKEKLINSTIGNKISEVCINCYSFIDDLAKEYPIKVCKCSNRISQMCIVVGTDKTEGFLDEIDDNKRHELKVKKLDEILILQHKERMEIDNSTKACVFNSCKFKCNYRLELTRHLLDEHNINIGLPDNIVFFNKLLQIISSCVNGPDDFVCLYCQYALKSESYLRKHMISSGHDRLDTTDSRNDMFYILNYAYPGYSWKEISKMNESEMFDIILDDDGHKIRDKADWDDWVQEDYDDANDDDNDDINNLNSDQFDISQNLNIPTPCLFCENTMKGNVKCLKHMLAAHGFNLFDLILPENQINKNKDDNKNEEEIELENEFSFYKAIKFLNLLRILKDSKCCFRCGNKYENWVDLCKHYETSKHSFSNIQFVAKSNNVALLTGITDIKISIENQRPVLNDLTTIDIIENKSLIDSYNLENLDIPVLENELLFVPAIQDDPLLMLNELSGFKLIFNEVVPEDCLEPSEDLSIEGPASAMSTSNLMSSLINRVSKYSSDIPGMLMDDLDEEEGINYDDLYNQVEDLELNAECETYNNIFKQTPAFKEVNIDQIHLAQDDVEQMLAAAVEDIDFH